MSFHLASLHTLQADVSKSSFKVESHLLSHSQKVESGVWRNVLLLPGHRTTGCKGYQTSVTHNGEKSCKYCRVIVVDRLHKTAGLSLGTPTIWDWHPWATVPASGENQIFSAWHKTEEEKWTRPTYLVSGVAEGLGHSAGVPRGSDPLVRDRPHRGSPGKGGPHHCLPHVCLFVGRRWHMLASLLSVCLLCGRKQKWKQNKQ